VTTRGWSRRRITRAFLFVLAAGGLAVGGALLRGGEPSAPPAPAAALAETALAATAVPRPVEPAFTPPRPRALRAPTDGSVWAPVLRRVAARARPDAGAPVVAGIATETPEGTDNIVLVVGRAVTPRGDVWVKVLIPALPDNAVVWVQRSALGGYSVVRTRLVVDLDRLRVSLYRGARRIFDARVGVGRPHWPTPKGHFYIRNKLTSFVRPVYGPVAFGTSARSSVLTDWPGGGFIGIHGTNEPQLLPGRVSHGCIRLRNRDILRLAKLMPVGTPVTIT
jgi:hypothetical protein